MSEYEELREKIAKLLYSHHRFQYAESNTLYRERDWDKVRPNIKEDYLKEADEILSIIADKCWLKDNNFVEPLEGGIASAFWLEGWRPVKEIKKDG